MSRVGDMSSVPSEQLWVCEGAVYDEVNPPGQGDPGTSSDKRNPLASSPSTRDEGLDMDGSENGSNENLANVEPFVQSVIEPNGLREFIILLLWTVNDFKSTIKEKHFNTLREKYQIPHHISILLPYKFEKCYYQGVDDVGIYEQMLKAGLRFLLSALHHRLLQYLGLAVTQVSPNA